MPWEMGEQWQGKARKGSQSLDLIWRTMRSHGKTLSREQLGSEVFFGNVSQLPEDGLKTRD